MEKAFLALQARRIRKRLQYYEATLLNRDGGYQKLKRVAVIPQLLLALAFIRAGTYGTCLGCGKTIARARLEQIPGSTRCVPCQNEFETK